VRAGEARARARGAPPPPPPPPHARPLASPRNDKDDDQFIAEKGVLIDTLNRLEDVAPAEESLGGGAAGGGASSAGGGGESAGGAP